MMNMLLLRLFRTEGLVLRVWIHIVAEPLGLDFPFLNPENVILTDHCGYNTEEALVNLKTKSAINILNNL